VLGKKDPNYLLKFFSEINTNTSGNKNAKQLAKQKWMGESLVGILSNTEPDNEPRHPLLASHTNRNQIISEISKYQI
jgi:hypothetical protein